MRLAIIDLGTNSVRFDVHQFGPGDKIRTLHREKLMVRLGQNVFLNGRLDKTAIQRTLHAFARFRRVNQQLRVDKVRAFGTSALREVSDRERFVDLVAKRTGIELRVISGAEEAKLIALGVLANESVPGGRFALVDIGGGSTEISVCQGGEVLRAASFPLGTARLQQLFLKRSPPDRLSIELLRNYVRAALYQDILGSRWPQVDRIIGSSGTIRALARILTGGTDKAFDREDLGELVERMGSMTTTELLGVGGMEAKRVDMILAGALLFEECMDALGAGKARSTDYSLRDGLLEEERRLFQQGEASQLGIHLEDLIGIAVKFGGEARYLRRTAALAEEIFRKLRPLHGLDVQWHSYLSAAAVLREVGQSISPSRIGEHSHYIVSNTDLPPMDDWEHEMICQLVLNHDRAKPVVKGARFAKEKRKREAFERLLGLLKILDALDGGPETRVKIEGLRRTRSEALIRYSGRNLTGLETLHIEMQGDFLERCFKRAVRAVRA